MAVFEQLPLRLDVIFRRGDSLRIPLHFQRNVSTTEEPVWEDIDLTDHTFLAQVRRLPNSEEILAVFTVEETNIVEGRIAVYLSAAQTEILPARETAIELRWDLQASAPDGSVRTRVGGLFSVEADVSRVQ